MFKPKGIATYPFSSVACSSKEENNLPELRQFFGSFSRNFGSLNLHSPALINLASREEIRAGSFQGTANDANNPPSRTQVEPIGLAESSGVSSPKLLD
ncbi:hypothetical protein ACCAA_790011 [Candidatus Accumulibacter aalborgensis]|uniref:Uncharacterized protein n=1 Tax=Candidatus Accumulibacter aalborgensis TaxID=1860102 RepID=A0A1A8XYS2_9PROT|nr:hypothetical protein ACCAA_790011 [Candidatus Accumulibacter aalborgensis]